MVIPKESREEFEKLLQEIAKRCNADIRDVAVKIFELGYDYGWEIGTGIDRD